jgi:hypothetical protein
MLSKEDVIYAYRLLFGREPEDEAVVRHYATEVHDLQSLRALFINSAEFSATLDQLKAPRPPRLQLMALPCLLIYCHLMRNCLFY